MPASVQNTQRDKTFSGCKTTTVVAAVLQLFAAGSVIAEEAASPPPGDQIQEVIVTAQRRAERLQDVPISAQVIGSQDLAQRNFNSLDTLSSVTPGLKVEDEGASSNLYIRGIGSAGNPSFDQSVATFVDDIYHGRARMSLGAFLDIDHIEVLKGPQSTFFGNNAIAGALNITTQKPGKSFDASARALYGNFGTYAAEGALTIPVTDTISTRLALTDNGVGGWIHNISTDKDAPKIHNQAARLTTVFKPTEDLDATLKIEGTRHAVTGSPLNEPLQVTRCPPPAPYVASGICAAALAQGVPNYSVGNIGFENASAAGQGNWLSTFENVLRVNYRKWDHTFTSVTGFYNYHFSENFGVDQTPANLLSIYVGEKYHQLSQELRIASDTAQPVQYLGGFYFQTDQLDPNPSSLDTTFRFLSPLLAGIPPLQPYLPLSQSQSFSQGERIYSVFASVNWDVTERLKLGAGIRGSNVHKNATLDNFYGTGTQAYGGVAPLPPPLVPIPTAILGALPPAMSDSRTDRAWMPSAKVQYKIDPAVMAYFSYSRGFKAGGFNGSDTTGDPTSIPFKPEYVNAYELGIKSELLENRLRVNLDVFRSDYSDLQSPVTYLAPSGVYVSVVRNAASSRSQGVELETQWIANQNFRFSANVSYIDAYYLSYVDGPTTIQQLWSGQRTRDLSGQPVGTTPPWTASVNADYSVPVMGGYRFTAELTPYFSSHYDVSDDPLQSQPGYVRLDARLSLATADDHWALDIIGKNLSDREIHTSVIGTTLAPGTLYITREQRRNVALQVRYRY